MSSYLFVLLLEVLSSLLNLEVVAGNIKPFTNNNFSISHLLYADDIIITTVATIAKCKKMKEIFKLYGLLTNQKVNLNKSGIYVPSKLSSRRKSRIKAIMNMNMNWFPFTYLGVPISYKQLTTREHSYLLDKFDSCLSNWK